MYRSFLNLPSCGVVSFPNIAYFVQKRSKLKNHILRSIHWLTGQLNHLVNGYTL